MHKVRLVWAAAALALTLVGCSRRRAEGGTPPAAAAAASARVAGRAAASAAPRSRSKGNGMWGANYFPNIPLTTHRGEKVRFFDLIKDKVVAVNFIYTKCSDSCPMETARMRDVERVLGDRLGKDVFFYSISIDPENDTPERLKEYAELWHTGLGWTFLTGKEEDVTLLRRKLGVYEADLKKRDHNLSMVIGNQATGRWMKRSPGENPYILANELGQWLHNWKLPTGGERDYADAPEVRNISTGEELFRARCASCHTVGGGDTFAMGERRIGPDLFDVTKRRERNWLERWVMAPDKMLAEKDPIATQLLAAYQNVVMPNMRLSKADADAVLTYLDEASAATANRGEYVRASAPAAPPGGDATPSASPPPFAPLPERALGPARSTLGAYEAMRAAFAADDLAGAKAQVAALADGAMNAATDGGAAQKALVDLAAAARAVGAAADMDGARLRFGDLSKRVVALLVGEPKLREGRHLFMCPMASGYKKWVQTTPALTNPYWGKQMLTCGKQLTDWAI